jgi:hypothetical protein
MRAVVLLLNLIFLYSLSSCNKPESIIVNKLHEAKKIEGKIISKTNEVLSEPLRMVCSSPFLIYSTGNNDKMIEYLNINSGTVINKVFNQGRGPNELMSIGSLQKAAGNEVFVCDHINKKVFSTIYDSCLLIKEAMFKDNVHQAFSLKNNLFVANGFFHDGRFKLFSNDTLLFNYHELICDETKIQDTSFINMGYMNFSSVSPDETKFANIIFNTEVVETFLVENDSIKKIWSLQGKLFPVTPLRIGKGTMAQQSEETFGFKNLCVTNRFIYCSFSKENFKKLIPNTANANYLFVFSWNGEIHTIYLLDHSVRTIAISPDDRLFYGTTIIDNDVKIVEYAL